MKYNNPQTQAVFDEGKVAGRIAERRRIRRVVAKEMADQQHVHCRTCWYLGEIIQEKVLLRKGKS